jgi:hypothetical protein
MNTIEINNDNPQYTIPSKESKNKKRQELVIKLKQFADYLDNLDLPFTIPSHEKTYYSLEELRVMTANTEYSSLQSGLDEAYDTYRFLNSCTAKECVNTLVFKTNQMIQIIER